MDQLSFLTTNDKKKNIKKVENHILPTNLTTNKHSFHRWFNFTAGYSPEYVDQCISNAKLKEGSTVLEPFSGCGTTLVQSNNNRVNSIGFEMNPFFVDICKAKTLCDLDINLVDEIRQELSNIEPNENSLDDYSEPALTYLNKLFSREVLITLSTAREVIERYEGNKKIIGRLILSQVLDLCSHSQTDGIYKAPTSLKRSTEYIVALERVCSMVEEDLTEAKIKEMKNNCRIIYNTSEDMSLIEDKKCDIMITSPPYLNNFDFAEMTRMYLYFWKYADSWGDITDKVTTKLIVNTTTALRGHKDKIEEYKSLIPISIHEELDYYQTRLLEKRKSKPRGKQYDFIVYPYFAQMTNVLKHSFRVLKNGAPAHIIVADAALYGIHIRTHEVLADIMKEIGFRDVKITKLRDRGNRWILEKREGTKDGLGEFEIIGYANHEKGEINMPNMENKSIYNIAKSEIEKIVCIYLEMVNETNNFEDIKEEHIKSEERKIILLNGIGSNLDYRIAKDIDIINEWQRRKSIPFDIENSITAGVYYKIREIGSIYYDELKENTNDFTRFDEDFIKLNPHYLPLYQHICNISSKQKLKSLFGSVSDNNISKPAATKISDYLNEYIDSKTIDKKSVLTKLDVTLEGIVRDLVGRIVLETIVANALSNHDVKFMREDEYNSLPGVVYDFRADFVLPDINNPKVFIEVRKSSSRHASLYAKDKMFSAINWKGKNPEMLAVLVTDGPWTTATLDVMTKVFDYVVPISYSNNLAKIIKEYLDGDKSKLKWIIDFKIRKN